MASPYNDEMSRVLIPISRDTALVQNTVADCPSTGRLFDCVAYVCVEHECRVPWQQVDLGLYAKIESRMPLGNRSLLLVSCEDFIHLSALSSMAGQEAW